MLEKCATGKIGFCPVNQRIAPASRIASQTCNETCVLPKNKDDQEAESDRLIISIVHCA